MDTSHSVLGLCSGAACMCCVGVATEFELVIGGNLKNLFESLTNFHQGVSTAGLSCCASPQTDSVKALSHIHHNSHNLVVSLILQSLTDRSQLSVKPKFVDVDHFLFLESVGPFAAVLVLRIFPFWSNSFLEKMIIGLDSEVGTGRDVVLQMVRVGSAFRSPKTYVNAPEFFDGVKGDDLLE